MAVEIGAANPEAFAPDVEPKVPLLEKQINKLLTQGRSKHITVICGMQRPVKKDE